MFKHESKKCLEHKRYKDPQSVVSLAKEGWEGAGGRTARGEATESVSAGVVSTLERSDCLTVWRSLFRALYVCINSQLTIQLYN